MALIRKLKLRMAAKYFERWVENATERARVRALTTRVALRFQGDARATAFAHWRGAARTARLRRDKFMRLYAGPARVLLRTFVASGWLRATKGVVRLVGADGALSLRDRDGRTLLHVAARHGRRRMCAWLLEQGALPWAKDSHGRTPLHEASAGGHDEIRGILCRETAGSSLELSTLRDLKGNLPKGFTSAVILA